MQEPFIDPSAADGLRRIREYVLAWLERLDYRGSLDRGWPPVDLGAAVWDRLERDFAVHWDGPVVANRDLARVAAISMVEDYLAAYPARRGSRYSVQGPLSDGAFRRCVLDFVHDLEEFEVDGAPDHPEATAAAFWRDVRERPDRWDCTRPRGPFVDHEPRAREVALETIRDYYHLRTRVARHRAGLAD